MERSDGGDFIAVLKQLPLDERPREKALKYGVERLSNRELLALLIRHGTAGRSALDIADDMLSDGLLELSRSSMNQLMSIKGIKKVKALEFLAWFELSQRMSYESCTHQDVINHPQSVIQWCRRKLGSLKQEHFVVIFLNCRKEVIGYKVLFSGTVDQSLVHPREIFKEAVAASCSSLLIVHNHPSGNTEPSAQDLLITESICSAGRMMMIPVLDHLIVSASSYFSFREHELIES